MRGGAAGKLDLAYEDIGEQQLKDIARPLRVHRVSIDRVANKLVDQVDVVDVFLVIT